MGLQEAFPGKDNPSPQSAVVEFAQQSEKLSHLHPEDDEARDVAVKADFVTPHDPVVVTSNGNRLPTVPLQEAHKLNLLREEALTGHQEKQKLKGLETSSNGSKRKSTEGSLKRSMPPFHTNPLFPPLPLYGPPSLHRNIQCLIFRLSSFFLSLAFLGVIVLGALFTSILPSLQRIWLKVTLRDPDLSRPFRSEELRLQDLRKRQEKEWEEKQGRVPADEDGFTPTEGGPDPIVCDPAYYARRVGLDIEEIQVQTEDGFLIDLWHVYDPKEYKPLPAELRTHRGPETFTSPRQQREENINPDTNAKPKFPVLLIHGLLQSSGAYCTNDDASLAFYLCKSGYDVWLGNNRCGFTPKHTLLSYGDPRMWAWNIRQMGVFDLPALTSRVLYETGFDKIGLICHSQGTTQALVALAKEQRPDLGEKLTVFCGLAPAAYAGPLIGKMYFKFMRVISPAMFRLMFGIHAFIPFMMKMHQTLNPRIYGWLGYKVFGFLFNWTDTRWDRGLRDRMFQFAPVYVSSESMRWWLGRECFAKHKCILTTKEEWRAEEREDEERRLQELQEGRGEGEENVLTKVEKDMEGQKGVEEQERGAEEDRRKPRGAKAWYDERAPPFALWVAGDDDLVDGGKLLRRFERGREPHVQLVHSKVIPEYEHLDVIWAMDATEKVFDEVKEVLWKTCDVRERCRVPKGCENVPEWRPKKAEEVVQEEELQSSSSEDLST